MAAANAWDFYNQFTEWIGDNTIDMDADAFNMALFLSTSNCATLTHDEYGDLTNEHASANGYTQSGELLDSLVWTRAAGSTKFDCANEVWTAAGGSIVCRFAVIYDDTHATDALVCYSLLDSAPADITATNGNTLTVAIHGSGIFTLAT